MIAEATHIANVCFPGFAREVSISGTGLHIVGTCNKAALVNRRHKFTTPSRAPLNWLEFYTTGRFMALGQGFQGRFDLDGTDMLLQIVPQGNPTEDVDLSSGPAHGYTGPQGDDELIRRMLHATGSIGQIMGSKASIRDLWNGDASILCQLFPSPSDDAYDRSKADAALMFHLAFWTGKDAARMDRLFRRSALMRAKYEQRPDYRRNTLQAAIGSQQKIYDRPVELSAGVDLTDPDQNNLALHFVDRHADTVRYVSAWRSWVRWDGKRWLCDSAGVRDMIRNSCAAVVYGHHTLGPSTKRSLMSSPSIEGVERHARSHGLISAAVDIWDADDFLLNTPGGIVDLRSGEMKPHDPSKFMTKITAVSPAEHADCPLWTSFLDRIFSGDRDLIRYVQHVAGYALTGSTREQSLFFGYGSGGNGKSVFLNVIRGIMGNYATVAAMDTFTASNQDQHPTGIASLVGARLVTASETEEGRQWAEDRIKNLTGSEPIKTRFMRQDYFEFTPKFTLVIVGNHKPGLRNVDAAMRRRLHLVPFTATIPDHERDARLEEKLKAESPAILRWMIEGCLQWQRSGRLVVPKVVADATNEYFSDEDAIGRFIAECCELEPTAWFPSSLLYERYRVWIIAQGQHPVSQKRFSMTLSERGYIKRDTREAKGFDGIRLKSTPHVSLPGLSSLSAPEQSQRSIFDYKILI